jgi:hypothetical protein
MAEEEEETRIEHPNRQKASSKAARAIIVLLLLVTAALVLIITVAGWKVLQGAIPLAAVYILLYAIMAWYVAKWTRGLLPVAAGFSILLAVIAAVSAPAWFARAKDGYEAALIDANMLGLLTLILVPISLVLVGFALRGFSQQWNVEVEKSVDDDDGDDRHGDAQPQGA